MKRMLGLRKLCSFAPSILQDYQIHCLMGTNDLSAPFIGIARHRIGVDGEGVTTLAAFHGCPLRCRYCLNPSCLGPVEKLPFYTPEQLYDKVLIDQLYFLATGGGVCFGGGEPLLRPDFIVRFRELCGPDWKLTIETSLNVDEDSVKRVLPAVNQLIVDVKDTDDEVYRSYTGKSNRQALSNLRLALSEKGPDNVIVRVPLIPEFNTEAHTDCSVTWLQEIGVTRVDRFVYRT